MGIEDFWGARLNEVLSRGRLSGEARRRVGEWAWLARESLSKPIGESRIVVVDTETSGLDVRHDRLLSIGACVIEAGRIPIAESFYREVRQERASGEANILIHGIGREAQLAGEAEADALSALLEFARKSPMAAFNAPFDHAFLSQAMRDHLGVNFRPVWLDLSELPKAMYPADAANLKTLDEWLERFAIVHPARHHALADAYCTAQLLLAMMAKAERDGYRSLGGLAKAQKNYQWQRR
jgi:DNA polymerase III subunit epsilon